MLQGSGLGMPKGAFGRLLRFWRRVHGLSQEKLALEVNASLRHISFLENSRSLAEPGNSDQAGGAVEPEYS